MSSILKTATNRKVQLAGFQRLLSSMSVEEPVLDQSHVMRLFEERAYAYTKTLSPRQLRDEAATIYAAIEAILKPFDFKHKPVFLALWNYCLCGGPDAAIRPHLETIRDIAINNDFKRLIMRDIRTPTKYKGVLKKVLNLGDSFASLFDEVDLTSAEKAIRDNIRLKESERCLALNALLDGQTFTGDEHMFVRTFYQNVRDLSDPNQRNTYFNKALVELLKHIKPGAPSIKHLNILVQLYDRLVNHELVATVNSRVSTYLAAHPIDFWNHSLCHMAEYLEPNSNFKSSEPVLDQWQRDMLRAIKERKNIFLNLPTSAGKTIGTSGVLDECEDAWFIVPTAPLADQLSGILLATVIDKEKRAGVKTERNVRLEVDNTTRTSYRRFQKAKDNIIVGMPKRMVELLQSKEIVAKPQYLILDEGHTIGCPVQGIYYEYLLKYAAFHDIPVLMCTATIRDEDYEELKAKILRLYKGTKHVELFSVSKKRRFFNHQYKVFRVDSETGDVTTVTLDPLESLTVAAVRSPTFHHPRLVPEEVWRLYERLVTFARRPVVTKIPTLDEVEELQEALFKHITELPDAELAALLPTKAVANDMLTPFQLYMTLKQMNDSQKPLLLFKMDSVECMRFFLTMTNLAKEMSALVYGDFQFDQPLLKQFLEEIEALPDAGGGSSEEAADAADKLAVQREGIYASKYLTRLRKLYKEYREEVIDPEAIRKFNETYGANLDADYIKRKRTLHARKQLDMKCDTIGLRTDYTIHDDIKISSYSAGEVMKEIRYQISNELAHQRSLIGEFKDMRDYGAEFAAFNDIEETVYFKKYDSAEPREDKRWKRTGDLDRHKLGNPWLSGRTKSPEVNDTVEYEYDIPYEHPILVGIEIGLFLCNECLNPAFNSVNLLLISKHPLIVVSDKIMVMGINLPIKSVWMHGSFKGEAKEVLNHTLARQATGRAPRRGLDKKATIFMDGIEVSCVVTPEYQPLVKNTPERMSELVKDEEVVFRDFVVTGERPATVATVATVVAVAPIVPVAVAKAVGGAGKPSTNVVTAATATAATTATAVALNSKTDFTGSWEDWATDS